MTSKLIDQSQSLCPKNIQCNNKECNLMHSRCFAGICIDNLNGKCKNPCPKNLIHITPNKLKKELKFSINGVFILNLCPKINCKSKDCYFLHRDWISKKNICVKYLIDADNCEGACENNQKHVDLEELQKEVWKEYIYKNLTPEQIIDENKTYNDLGKFCLKYFKGICDYKGCCPKIHIDWEDVKNVSSDQFEKKILIPCTKSAKPLLVRMDSKSFKKLDLHFDQQKLQQIALDIKAKNILDLVFIMDCTSSMSKWIEQARENITDIIENFHKIVPQTQIRISFVGYRDFNDKPHVQYHDFTTDIKLIQQFISTLKATGGDDWAEDVAGGIEQALKLSYSKHPQSVLCTFLICDAPTHGKQYHDPAIGDDYADKIKDGSLEKLMQTLDQKKSPNNYFFCCKLHDSTTKMFEIMKQNFKNLEISTLEPSNFTKFVSLSMITSFKLSSLGPINPSKTKKVKAYFVWHKPIEPIECTEKNKINYFSHFLTQMGKNQLGGETILDIQIDQKQLSSDEQGMVSYIFEAFDIRNNLKIIIKLPKDVVDLSKKGQINKEIIKNAQRSSFVRYNQTLIAKQLSCAYRLATNQNKEADPIFYVTPIKYTLCDEENFFGLTDLYAETNISIDGPWEKISNNANFMDKEKENYSAFSHFTYNFTNKSLLITDLQGKKGVFSDPCIHTKEDIQYLKDETNQCLVGIQTFFDVQHVQCNTICQNLKLKRNCDIEDIPKDRSFLELKQINIQKVNAVCPVCSDVFQITYEDYNKGIDTCASCNYINEFLEICECCGNEYKYNLNKVLKQALNQKICDQCQKDCANEKCLECTQSLQKQIIDCKECKKKNQCYYCKSKCTKRNIRSVNSMSGESQYLCEEACIFYENLYCSKCLSEFKYQKWPSIDDYVKGQYYCQQCQKK